MGIVYAWSKEPQCKEYMQKWVTEKKMTQRVEDLQPSDWFKTKYSEWNKQLSVWKRKQADFKDPSRRRAYFAAKKKEAEAKKKKEAEEAKKAAEDAKKDGEDGED